MRFEKVADKGGYAKTQKLDGQSFVDAFARSDDPGGVVAPTGLRDLGPRVFRLYRGTA
jgi:hypothetical protein